jgi:hypothetical protein
MSSITEYGVLTGNYLILLFWSFPPPRTFVPPLDRGDFLRAR